MLTSFLFIVSSLLFISNFGIHALILSQERWEQPPYVDNQILCLIPWLSGYVFSVIPIIFAFDFNWIVVFLINVLVNKYLGGAITHGYMIRFASGKSLGTDLLTSFIASFGTMILGLILKYIL